MTNPTALKGHDANQDRVIWSSLRKAIAKSSGFQRWQKEQDLTVDSGLDVEVRRYLEETLETLAY